MKSGVLGVGPVGVEGRSVAGPGVRGVGGTAVHGEGDVGVEGFATGLEGGTGVFGRAKGEASIGVIGFANTGVHGEGDIVGVAGKGIPESWEYPESAVASEYPGKAAGTGPGGFGASSGPDGAAVHGFYRDETTNFGIGVIAEVDTNSALPLYAVNNADGRELLLPRAAFFVRDVESWVLSRFLAAPERSRCLTQWVGTGYCIRRRKPRELVRRLWRGGTREWTRKSAHRPDFAVVADTRHSHIFLTPYGDSQGLYVSARHGDEFEVREQRGGSSSLAFSYRVVAKRASVTGERFKKVSPSARPRLPTRPKAPNVDSPSLTAAPPTGATYK